MLLRTGCYRGTTPRPGATRCRPNHLAIGIREPSAGLDSTRFTRSQQRRDPSRNVWDRMTRIPRRSWREEIVRRGRISLIGVFGLAMMRANASQNRERRERSSRERERETRRPWKCETRRVHWRRYQSAGIGFQWMNRRLWMCLFDFA